MQITNTEIQGTKYVQIYLTEEELQKKETKDLVKKYKQEKYSVAIFVSGKENCYLFLFKLQYRNRVKLFHVYQISIYMKTKILSNVAFF